ncbi:MAG: alanine--tRNA ligase [Anaeromyxobacteraceae bacterium]
MTTRTAAEIRDLFLRFFEERGHRRVASSSLVPQNDPTLLFTNAGMVQFKDVFTGREKRDYTRATTSQKCVRAGGKHNDLENVGFTARHHTFFEMLGNFSFGDYFKKDAVAWGWEFVTSPKWLGLAKDRLAATVFDGEGGLPWDEEAYALWKAAGVPEARIHKLGAKDNFWAMGDTGPCGPCSELHFFQGDDVPCAEEKAGKKCLGVACDCDRWLEIWNLVFMQFERAADGSLKPLPRPSIDTGAGLERMASVAQGKRSNYDTDLFRNIIAAVEKLSGKKYGGTPEGEDDVSMRVIADHARATTFLVGDGVLPSNEGRGYVLRRIMRRAIRHGKRLGLEKVFLADVCGAVIHEMGAAYPETRENLPFITKVAQQEEESFRRTLDKGLAILEGEIDRLGGNGVIDGKVAFQLYDTFGFPMDLTRVIAAERGVGVDEAGFDRSMAEQRARSEWKGSGEQAVGDLQKAIAQELGAVKFLGYEAGEAKAQVKALLVAGARAAKAKAGDKVEVVTDATPFYGESGGQVGDTGVITGANGLSIKVEDAQRPVQGLVTHLGVVEAGEVAVGDQVALAVDEVRRDLVRANHSATHLLHLALREKLGEHVKQAGSIVAPDYLRFDFAHFQPLSDEERTAIERRVNDLVRENAASETAELKLEEARKTGAMMIFGEKYGDVVRVVRLGPSKELCGGTHVRRTGDIAFFKIQSEESIAAGVRRIVAVTGPKAVELAQRTEDELQKAAALLRASTFEVAAKVEATQKRVKELERALEEAKGKVAAAQSGDLAGQAKAVGDAKVLAAKVQGDGKALRDLADKLRDKLGRGVVALASEQDGKAVLLVAVTKDLTAKVKAGDLVKEAAKLVGGAGGGKPDLAQAGGSDPAGIEKALAKVEELVGAALG